MTRLVRVFSRPILVVVAVVALGAAVWGSYVWRAMHGDGLEVAPPPVATAESPASATPLRATRPIAEIIQKIEAENALERSAQAAGAQATPLNPTEENTTGGSSVRANAPPTDTAVEMTAGRRAPPSRIESDPLPIHTPVRKPAAESTSARGQPRLAMSPGRALEMGRSALGRGDVIEARTLLSAALDRGLPESEERFIRGELSRLSDALLFSRAANTDDPLAASHSIASGETLHGIAARHRVTDDLLGRINGISEPNRLRVGQRIKVIHGPFRAEIRKSDHRMDVFLGDAFVRSFPVGLGQNGYTPTGTWVVNNKLRNPSWTDPVTNRHYLADDPDNPVGERWIGLSGVEGDALGKVGFGIHGTIDPASIGRDMSLGCIRMAAADVEWVYELLVLQESRVVVRP